MKCIDFEKPNTTVVTFDLPIWVRAVDIIESQKLLIVSRLGGFHLLKWFLGTFGSLFADSGLYSIIQLIYSGQVVADSIHNGNSFDKAIRSHILIDAAIVHYTLPPESFTEIEVSQMKGVIKSVLNEPFEIDDIGRYIVDLFQ